jgi:hypothetical protein
MAVIQKPTGPALPLARKPAGPVAPLLRQPATPQIIPDKPRTLTTGTGIISVGDKLRAAKKINVAAKTVEWILQSVSAQDQIIPVLYGEPLYLGVRIAGVVTGSNNTVLHILGVLGYGPLNRIDGVYLDNVRLTGSPANGQYLGTATQAVDSVIKTAYAAHGVTFTDTMQGYAYVRLSIPQSVTLQSAPNISVQCTGRTVYDMRNGNTVPSGNPVLCLADFIMNPTYGLGATYDTASFSAAANFCDEATPDGPRYRMALALTEAQRVDDWLAQLEAYTGCILYRRGGTYYLAPLRPRATTITVGKSNIIAETFDMQVRSQRDLPTRVTVSYTDWSTFPPSSRTASQQNSTDGQERESALALAGVTSYAMASRIAGRRLNSLWYGQLTAGWKAFDEAITYRSGDVLALTFPEYGLNGVPFWITALADQGFGRWAITAESYDPNAFVDTALPAPPLVNTGDLVPPSNAAPPLIGPITAVEELDQFGNGDFRSRLAFSWPDTTDPANLAFYSVILDDVTDPNQPALVLTANVPVAAFTTGWLSDSRIYRLYVVAVGLTGLSSAMIQSADILVLGKTAPPSNVTGFTAIEAGGSVYCSWNAVPDLDRDEYEIRRGPVGTPWASMVVVTKLHATNTVLASQPVGAVDYAIKAKDTSGNYSVTEARQTVTVTLDENVNVTGPNPLSGYTWSTNVSVFGTPPLTMVNTDLAGYWQDGADVPDNTVGTFNDSLVNVIIALPSNDPAWIQTAAFDFGAIINTQVQVAMTYTLLAGTAAGVVPLIETSTDNITFVTANPGDVRPVRYVRARMNIAAGTIVRTHQDWTISLITVLVSENGNIAVGATGKATVTLTNRYAAWVAIQCTPQANTTTATAAFDNVIVGSGTANTFDVWLFKNNAVASGTVAWTFRGVR